MDGSGLLELGLRWLARRLRRLGDRESARRLWRLTGLRWSRDDGRRRSRPRERLRSLANIRR
eukprot:1528269-Pyramimonas_sp.AAC.1